MDVIAFGEVGLAGECRSVNSADIRVNEARRLGFKKIILPYQAANKIKKKYSDVELMFVRSVYELLKIFS